MKKTSQATDDSFLLSAMQRGDKKAYGTLFRRYYPMLCTYANRFVSLEDAEEIVQDIMSLRQSVFTFIGCVNFTTGGDSLECLPVGTYQCINRKFIKFE